MITPQWWTTVWDLVQGCTRVSAGCANCSAEGLVLQKGLADGVPSLAAVATPRGARWTGVLRLRPEAFGLPARWRRAQRIFVCPLSDLFHEDVPDDFRDRVFGIMTDTPRHTFMLLTKRPEALVRYVERWGPLAPNIWPGVSVEDQPAARRLDPLLALDADHLWVNCEPLIGPVDLEPWVGALTWVCAGHETGEHARPMDPAWPRLLRDRCREVAVPFFLNHAEALDGRVHLDVPIEAATRDLSPPWPPVG